jgi:DNA-binding transcriptional LysR family regulator
MELRHLRYFVTVAEELHFTRAAERLQIRQPPLSIQIRRLEEELGAPLFRRLSRGVELTEAGKFLLPEARAILARVDRAAEEVWHLARGESGKLRVGFAGATYFQPLLPAIVREYRRRYPQVELLPEQSNTPAMLSGLDSACLDAAFVRPPISGVDRIAVDALIEEQTLAVLPTGHSLSGASSVALESLASETFILFPRAIGYGLYDSIISACHRAGFSPRLGQDAPQITSIIPMVAAGFGVSVVPYSTRQIQVEGAVFKPISGVAPRASIGLAYRRDERSRAVRNFVAVAREVALG